MATIVSQPPCVNLHHMLDKMVDSLQTPYLLSFYPIILFKIFAFVFSLNINWNLSL